MEQNGMKGVEEQEGRENGIKWKRCEIIKNLKVHIERERAEKRAKYMDERRD